MKKILALILASLMLLASLSACSSSEPADTDAQQPATDETTQTAEEPEWITTGNTPLSDVRVREALAYAIDMDTIAATIFNGRAEPASSLTTPGVWQAEDLNAFTYDPDKAIELLAEAQWPSDYVLDVVYHYSDQQTVDFLTIITQYWEAVGVKAEIRKLEGDIGSQFQAPPVDRENGPSGILYDIGYGAIAPLTAQETYNRFASTSSGNSTLQKIEGLDELIEQLNSTSDIAEQQDYCKQIQTIMNDNVSTMPLYHQPAAIFVSDRLDIKDTVLGNNNFYYNDNILDWEIDDADGIMYTNTGPVEFFQMTSLNPALYMYQKELFDRLISSDYQLTPTEGMLAETYEISEDQLTYTFNIQPEATWHDGEVLDGEDVKFTIEAYLQIPGGNGVMVDTLSKIKGAQAFIDGTADSIEGITVDGKTVVVEFESLAANSLVVFAQWPILPQHLLADANFDAFQQDPYWQSPVGSGPFEVGEVVFGNYATLERWDGYYGEGTGNIQTIHMFASADNDANLVKNATGNQIDYAWSKNVADAESIEALEHMTTYPIDIQYTRMFYINQIPHEPYNK